MGTMFWLVKSLACRGGWPALCLLAALAPLTAAGCSKKAAEEGKKAAEVPIVEVVQPQYRNIVRVVGQPSFVESYERTSVYPKVTGYIEKWYVDIGDPVKKGDLLCRLYVPELVEDQQTKWFTWERDKSRLLLAKEDVMVAKAQVESAVAALKEAKEIVEKYKADTWRWDSEVNRLEREVKRGVIDPQVLLESQNQYRQSRASWMAAEAAVEKKAADLKAAEHTLEVERYNVDVKSSVVDMSHSDAKRLDAWVGYLTIPAPFDGIIVARNANTFDFVLPRTGDPSADIHAPHLSPSGSAAPIYVVDRTDMVRIYVDIPEGDSNYVKEGAKARVQIRAWKDQWVPSSVTRTSWALNVKSRTLRAEIDLDNKDQKILPGMYAYGKVIIEHDNVLAVPASALVRSNDTIYYWAYEDGKAVRTEVQTGVSDGTWVEVTSRQKAAKSSGEEGWVQIGGAEKVIVGDLSGLSDGEKVRLQDKTGPREAAKPEAH